MLKSRKEIRVVVLGAGLAGLSAARKLMKSGFDNTIVLEASERLGGRINSIYFGDIYCELGAKWITIDGSKNSAYELISRTQQYKPMVLKTNENFINNEESYCMKRFRKQINFKLKNILCQIGKKYSSGNLKHIDNVQIYMNTEIDKIIKSMNAQNDKMLACNIFKKRFGQSDSLYACCLQNVNIEHIIHCIGKDNPCRIYLPTGMDNILYSLTKNFNNKIIKTAHPVSVINWYDSTDPKKKTISCLNGSLFNADHIICTLPLGVLKNFAKYLFYPNLPENKSTAIKNLGFACPMKIFFEYNECITPWLMTKIISPWLSNDNNILNWTKKIIDISKTSTSQKVLEITIGGPFIEQIEKLPDTEILLDVTMLLRRYMKNPLIPYPVSLLRSNWSSNACFLGGKPFISTASTRNDVEELAAPVGESLPLLFAGDATILDGFGSLDAARKSGLREAQRIIDYYNKKC